MTKQELRAFRAQHREVTQIRATLDRLYDEIGAPASDPAKESIVNRRRSGSPVEKTVESYVTLEGFYKARLDAYASERCRIEKAIEILKPNERAVIRSYYLDHLTWEATAYLLDISYPHVHRLHKAALEKLEGTNL